MWRISASKVLDLSPEASPRILGILNTTPDSFSDGGLWVDPEIAAEHGARMIAEGAIGVDVGGESTRPGATRVDAAAQRARVIPVIAALRRLVGDGPAVTIDTTLGEVAKAALDAGADAVNDVSGGTEDPTMLPLVASHGCGIVLMHRRTTPEKDSYSTRYGEAGEHAPPTDAGDVVTAVKNALSVLVERALTCGVAQEAIVIDPGLGFGKTVEQNLALLRRTRELIALGYPVMSGLSRKSFTARAAGLPDDTLPAQRLDATVALSQEHRRAGARLFRVHDVAEHARLFASEPLQ